jgi:uncharacterized protein (DUF1800 family)
MASSREGRGTVTTSFDAITAVNRFGMGAKAGELAQAKPDPRGWLLQQINGARALPEVIAALPTSPDVFQRYTDAQEARRDAKEDRKAQTSSTSAEQAKNVIQGVRKVLLPVYLQQVAARYQVASETGDPLHERLVHFWTNHFAVSADKVVALGLAAGLENEAIRPHLSGHFVEMLLAVERHPAMILYLDNQQSSGPNSQLAQFAQRRRPDAERKIGINENLAREILELHTLGVNGGYTQTDVTTFAQALTGWSVGGGRGRMAQGVPGAFVFREAVHEPGAKSILGKRYGQDGYVQAKAVLEDLAKQPATAKFIATKLVRHFVNDEPPADAVQKVAKAFTASDGHLPTVYRAVIDLQTAWQQPQPKFKTPHEFFVSTMRSCGFSPKQPQQILSAFDVLGQRPYTPGSPAGWPDTASQWDGPDALMKRIEWSTGVGQRLASRAAPLEIAQQALGDALSDHTRTAISRAASGAQALTLLLMSPEFQRR